MQHRSALAAAALAAATVSVAGPAGASPLTNSHRVLASCDSSGGKSGEQVCASMRVEYIAGTCDPVKFDVKNVKVRVTNGANNLEDTDPLRDWTFEVTRGNGDVVFARYNVDVQKDKDGSVDQKWVSVAYVKQGSAHLSIGGEVNVNNGKNWTASINFDLGPKSGCLV